jgi:hypothetical protein
MSITQNTGCEEKLQRGMTLIHQAQHTVHSSRMAFTRVHVIANSICQLHHMSVCLSACDTCWIDFCEILRWGPL